MRLLPTAGQLHTAASKLLLAAWLLLKVEGVTSFSKAYPSDGKTAPLDSKAAHTDGWSALDNQGTPKWQKKNMLLPVLFAYIS